MKTESFVRRCAPLNETLARTVRESLTQGFSRKPVTIASSQAFVNEKGVEALEIVIENNDDERDYIVLKYKADQGFAAILRRATDSINTHYGF